VFAKVVKLTNAIFHITYEMAHSNI